MTDAPLTRVDRALLEGLTEHVLGELRTERDRQVAEEGYSLKHDEAHGVWELAAAAAAYAWNVAGGLAYRRFPILGANLWPWHHAAWKPKDEHRDLVRAGALIVAALERLHRDAIIASDVEAS